MQKQYLKLLLGVSILLVAMVTYFMLRPTTRERCLAGYPKINKGDTKQKVVELLGRPDKVDDCYSFGHAGATVEQREVCAEQYFYRGGFEQWIFVFDTDKKVISKSHNISY